MQMESLPVTIRKARESDLRALSALFDSYRQFYRQPPDSEGASFFIKERLVAQDSVIFIAIAQNLTIGFVQLYPSFSSVAMKRVFILNDLFVSPSHRHKGIASALLKQSEVFASEMGSARLTLATEIVNTQARSLYEKLEWGKDETFIYYNKVL